MNNAIKEVINIAGSQQKLAKSIGLSQGMVSHVVTGVRPVSKRIADKFSSFVGGRIPWHVFMEAEQGPTKEAHIGTEARERTLSDPSPEGSDTEGTSLSETTKHVGQQAA